MSNLNDITLVFSYLGGLQGILLALVIWFFPTTHKTPNRFLSLFVISLAILLILPRIMEQTAVLLLGLGYGVRLLIPTALFFYVKTLHEDGVVLKQWPYLVPWLLDVLIVVFIVSYPSWSGNPIQELPVFIFNLSQIWPLLICIAFVVLIYKEIQLFKTKIQSYYSSEEKRSVEWIQQVLAGFTLLIIIDTLSTTLTSFDRETFKPYHSLINTLTYTFFMYFVMIKGKLNPNIYKVKEDLLQSFQRKAPPEVTETSVQEVSEDLELLPLAEHIKEIIVQEKLYLLMGLTVTDVATRLDLPSYVVSNAINAGLGQNFFELINRLRVEEAKRMLSDETYNHLSVLGIGYEAGFNSKTAFNIAFKKYTGTTPSTYKKKQQATEEVIP